MNISLDSSRRRYSGLKIVLLQDPPRRIHLHVGFNQVNEHLNPLADVLRSLSVTINTAEKVWWDRFIFSLNGAINMAHASTVLVNVNLYPNLCRNIVKFWKKKKKYNEVVICFQNGNIPIQIRIQIDSMINLEKGMHFFVWFSYYSLEYISMCMYIDCLIIQISDNI